MSWSHFIVGQAAYRVATVGESAYMAGRKAVLSANQTFQQENRAAQDDAHYPAVFRARLRHMRWLHSQPFSLLPVNTFTLFLIGVIALRLGLFDAPGQHQRLIVALMAVGLACWMAEVWLMPVMPQPTGPLILTVALRRMEVGFGLVRGMWLAFVYIGAVLLLAARSPRAFARLAPFGWAGRMALTNYMLQIAILDLAFSNYALHLTPGPLQSLAAGLTLFACMAAASRWWLARFRFGPLEWLWRSITYGRPQPWRVEPAVSAPATS
jgi:uncharacterized protein